MDCRLALMTGVDIPIPEIQAVIHQPTIKEISMIGEETFFIGLQTLVINKNMILQGKSGLENTSNFQIFMTIMKEKETADKKEAAQSVLMLLFPKHQVIFTPNSIILNQEGGSSLIDDSNFDTFQAVLSKVFCINSGPMDQQTFNPVDDKAREIAEKLMRGRQRVAQQKGDSQGSTFARQVSILTIAANSMSLNDVINLTMFQLYDLMERYSLHLNWELDVKTRLAGGKPESKPEDWMKNLH